MLPPDIAEAAGASSSAAELDDGDGIDVTEKLQRLNLYFERENVSISRSRFVRWC